MPRPLGRAPRPSSSRKRLPPEHRAPMRADPIVVWPSLRAAPLPLSHARPGPRRSALRMTVVRFALCGQRVTHSPDTSMRGVFVYGNAAVWDSGGRSRPNPYWITPCPTGLWPRVFIGYLGFGQAERHCAASRWRRGLPPRTRQTDRAVSSLRCGPHQPYQFILSRPPPRSPRGKF